MADFTTKTIKARRTWNDYFEPRKKITAYLLYQQNYPS
jgi:hypothetical protein